MTFPDDDRLDPRTAELLAGARRSVTPDRDLWPGIEGHLRRRRGAGAQRRVWVAGLAIAAALLLTVATLRRGPPTHDPRLESESVEVQATLIATTGPRSATAHSLAKHLSILDGAIAETEAALRETSGDAALLDFLHSLQHRRLTLLAQAARFAAES